MTKFTVTVDGVDAGGLITVTDADMHSGSTAAEAIVRVYESRFNLTLRVAEVATTKDGGLRIAARRVKGSRKTIRIVAVRTHDPIGADPMTLTDLHNAAATMNAIDRKADDMGTCGRCGGRFPSRTSGVPDGVVLCTSAAQCDENLRARHAHIDAALTVPAEVYDRINARLDEPAIGASLTDLTPAPVKNVRRVFEALDFNPTLAAYINWESIAERALKVGANWEVVNHPGGAVTVSIYWMDVDACDLKVGGCGRAEDPRTGAPLTLVGGLCAACREAAADAAAEVVTL